MLGRAITLIGIPLCRFFGSCGAEETVVLGALAPGM
jgi:hypothetical protein